MKWIVEWTLVCLPVDRVWTQVWTTCGPYSNTLIASHHDAAGTTGHPSGDSAAANATTAATTISATGATTITSAPTCHPSKQHLCPANPASGMSLDYSFPHVNPVLWLAVAKHAFCPRHLFKLDAMVKQKLTAKSFEISDNSAYNKKEMLSPKDYHPSTHSLTPSLFTLRSYSSSLSHLATLLQSTRSISAALSISAFSIKFTYTMNGLQYSNTILCSTTTI